MGVSSMAMGLCGWRWGLEEEICIRDSEGQRTGTQGKEDSGHGDLGCYLSWVGHAEG